MERTPHTSTTTVWIEGTRECAARDAASAALCFVRDRQRSLRPLTLLFRRSSAAETAQRTIRDARERRLIPDGCLVYIDMLPPKGAETGVSN